MKDRLIRPLYSRQNVSTITQSGGPICGRYAIGKGGSVVAERRRFVASRWWSVLAVAVALAGLSACEPDKPAGPAGRFVYDAAGRLAGVVDPADQAAVYRYDALSNLVAVHRYPASELGVMAVLPARASVRTLPEESRRWVQMQ